MKMIEGNLLIIITFLAEACFLGLWSHYYEGSFKRVFDFYRRRNRRSADRQAAKLIAGISVAAVVLYYVVCRLLKYSGLPVFSAVMVVLALLLSYLLFLSLSVVRQDALTVLIWLGLIMVAPSALFIGIIYWGALLDRYYMYISAILLLLCAVIYIKVSAIWKGGDLI
ncbi:MAG: hypothetical protein NC124_06175 [Clostridium sp.]|nr:hypothetical protein [Clostridium sp.]